MTLDALRDLPPLDKIITLGGSIFSRKQLKELYDPSVDDELIAESLQFGKSCLNILKSSACRHVFTDTTMARLEWAVMLFVDAVPDEHPIKKQHSNYNVMSYLMAARLQHYGCLGAPYIRDITETEQ